MIHEEQPEIAVYYSPWKNLRVFIVCAVFTLAFVLMIIDNNPRYAGIKLWAWIGLVFVAGTGLVIFANMFYMLMKHIPYIKIFDDRMEYYISAQKKYKAVYFKGVEGFRLVNMSRTEFITIDYKPEVLNEKYESPKTSGFKKWLFSFNNSYTGAIEAMPASMFKMQAKEICDILNERVQVFNGNSTQNVSL